MLLKCVTFSEAAEMTNRGGKKKRSTWKGALWKVQSPI